MGTSDLWSEALGNINKQPSVPFTTAGGKIIGIDISVWLHKNIHTDLNAQCLLAHPPYPPTDLVTSIKCLHNNLVKAGVIPYYVFDGSRHPMKSVARQQRDKKLEKAREHIENFYSRGRNGEIIDEEHRIEALKYSRDLAVPTIEILGEIVLNWMKPAGINYCCAPFEAEHQLIQMEKDGRIQGIMTEDGDAIILGANKVYFKVDVLNSKWKIYDAILSTRDTPLGSVEKIHWPAVGNILGSDYCKRVKGMGVKRCFEKLLPRLDTFTGNEIEQTIKSIFPRFVVPENFVATFNKAVGLFKHCPVLDLHGNLLPLHPLPPDSSWLESIGFDPISLLDKSIVDFLAASKFDGPCFSNGRSLHKFNIPIYNAEENTMALGCTLPRFARLNLDIVPIVCLQTNVLQCWITARLGYPYPGQRHEIERVIYFFLKRNGPTTALFVSPSSSQHHHDNRSIA